MKSLWDSYISELVKGTCANFTHQSVFTGVGEYYCICEKSRRKPLVSPEGAVV